LLGGIPPPGTPVSTRRERGGVGWVGGGGSEPARLPLFPMVHFLGLGLGLEERESLGPSRSLGRRGLGLGPLLHEVHEGEVVSVRALGRR
jgi:hypothetical protein